MASAIPLKNPANRSSSQPARPPLPGFYLDPRLYRAFPPAHRAELVALFNVLVAFGRDTSRPVLSTQAELADLLGLCLRQVRILEGELEDLGAVRVVRDWPGLRGGRALELVPLDEWLPDGLWKGSRPAEERLNPDHAPEALEAVSAPSDLSTSAVENPGRAASGAGVGGMACRPQPRYSPDIARARQSTQKEEVTRSLEGRGERDAGVAAPVLARRLFGFLARKTGLSGRRWKEALPELEALAHELGHDAAWAEVERIAGAARMATNPGGYAYACLFRDGLPERPARPLRALEPAASPGPLFRGLEPERVGKPVALAHAARALLDATPGPGSSPDAR